MPIITVEVKKGTPTAPEPTLVTLIDAAVSNYISDLPQGPGAFDAWVPYPDPSMPADALGLWNDPNVRGRRVWVNAEQLTYLRQLDAQKNVS
jgi:hypothetical protein